MGEMFEVTREWIDANATPAGGYKYLQLRSIGAPAPPVAGWKEKSIGKLITQAQRMKFEAFSLGYKATTKSKQALASMDGRHGA